MLTVPSFFLVTASLLHPRIEAYASVCFEPELPCEVPFTATCIDLLKEGEVTTEHSLRDDVVNGGCILCVSPGGVWTGPNPCPRCYCHNGEIGCVKLAGGYVEAAEGTAPCPASEYQGFTDFSVMSSRCPSLEETESALDCGAAVRDEGLEGVVHIVSSKASLAVLSSAPSSSPSADKAAWITSTENVPSATKRLGCASFCTFLAAWILCFIV
jgi:hypothetical protein